MSFFKIKNLDFSYSKKTKIISGISFDVFSGDIVSILGVNGCGKTTIMKNLIRVLYPSGGCINVNDIDINKMSSLEVAKNISYVGQFIEKKQLTVLEYILLGRRPYVKYMAGKTDYEIVDKVIRDLDLTLISNLFINEISGGQLQKVAIARALAQQPKFICLDEPTSSLDLRNQLAVLDIVTEHAKKNNIGVIMIIHDINLALKYSNKFLLVKDGKVFLFGGMEIINGNNIKKVFGVDVEVIHINGRKMVFVH
ncbi:ABC transporter ATP-binding protein [Salmonella enterica]|nr:ABC transporter ATP-binding protein [Salmonella enterica]EGY5277862.1 ABC transporter ATP-binding protein [Salmonella enterica]EHG4045836.1 ABC transporter ATP-binding protein [Salmonella enterica]EHM7583968.1 ABC transporter ATP-binding protein [Salmonella enterica]EHM7593183.1 ABC transporter ATP-binding protein [Salmonella enterica]